MDIDLSTVCARASQHHLRMTGLARETTPEETRAVLVLGAGVLLHAALEPVHLGPVLHLADPAVVATLAADHERLGEDLEFLEELLSRRADEEELHAVAAGLLERLRAHLERDQRLLYGPMVRLLEGRAAQEPSR